MLIGIFTYIFYVMLGGDGVFVRASEYIEKMEDKSRKEQLMQDVNKAKSIYKSFQTEYVTTMKALYMKEDASWTKELVQKTLDSLNEKRYISRRKLLDIRFEMKDKLTQKEWQEAFFMQKD